jgi:3-dehydroquinate synthase
MPAEATATVPVAAGGGSYPVLVGEGVLERLPALLREHAPAHRYALIADERVAGLHADTVLATLRAQGLAVEPFTFAEGEVNKSRESWSHLTDALLAAGFGRDAAVLALGGGVTGDLAGFVAATYMRGLPLVQLPTSLLAMVDSSVGGKVGVDTPAGKNLVGAFHPPLLVVADTATLRTLPPRQVRAGLAEAVKHGAIADAGYLSAIERGTVALLAADPAALADVVRRSVEIKAAVVSNDEREAGPRKVLNFGHTLGHAVEALSGFTLLHGEAIAIGMLAEARLGEALGVTEPGCAARLEQALAGLDLPTRVPAGMRDDDLLALTRTDKKTRGGAVEYALLTRVGAATWNVAAPDEAVLQALSS